MAQIRFILLAAVFCCIVYAQNEPFALGADISWIPQREAGGVRYADNGQVKDIFDILKEHKFNYIRLRLFVDPTAKIPNESESPYSSAGYCGLNSTISMAKRVKAAGMKFLLDFHYSDTWADPGKQYKPMSWQDLTTLAQLSAKVRSYTKETLEAFKAQGVLPDMVQIGNETVSGMIWDVGKNYSPGSWSNFATLVNAGIDGVRDVDANIKIMVHTINERNPTGWLTNLKNNGVKRVDVFGLSYYTQWHGQPEDLKIEVNRIATTHPEVKVAIAEYSGNHRLINDIIFDLPNKKGFGTFVWEPADWNDGGYGNVLFDWKNNRRETNTLIDLYPQMSIDYGINASSSSGAVSSSSSVAPSSSSRAVSSSSVRSSSSAVSSSASICTASGPEVFWNFSDEQFVSALPANITQGYTISGLDIVYGNGTMNYNQNNKSIDGYDFNYRFQLAGTGFISNRALRFNVAGASNITVYGIAGNSAETRALALSNGTSELQTINFPGDVISRGIYAYSGDAATLYLYSKNSGINIYGVKVNLCEGEPTPILPQIATSYKTAQISVQSATGNAIVLENLPSSAKVEVYSLRGELVYMSTSFAGTRLVVPINTKGVYVVKISTP